MAKPATPFQSVREWGWLLFTCKRGAIVVMASCSCVCPCRNAPAPPSIISEMARRRLNGGGLFNPCGSIVSVLDRVIGE